jgi:hypothetical protein
VRYGSLKSRRKKEITIFFAKYLKIPIYYEFQVAYFVKRRPVCMVKCEVSSGETHFMPVLGEGVEV